MNWTPPADGELPEGWQAVEEDNSPLAVLRRNMVTELKADGDCVNLQAAFDRSDDADELRYIDDALRDAGCYD